MRRAPESGSGRLKMNDEMTVHSVIGACFSHRYTSAGTDDLTNTVCVAEILAMPSPLDNRGVWAFPAAGSSNVGLGCDKKCQGINDDPTHDWIPYCNLAPNQLPCTFQKTEEINPGPRIMHPQAANALFSDWSIRGLSESLELEVVYRLFTSSDGEVVETF